MVPMIRNPRQASVSSSFYIMTRSTTLLIYAEIHIEDLDSEYIRVYFPRTILETPLWKCSVITPLVAPCAYIGRTM